MTASEIIQKYISFFEKPPRNHLQIANSSLVPENDPTTLFTSSGMQPLVPYLLGEKHPSGVRLVNVQNCFRAQDIDEVGDNRHTTFFRMLGNWSLGDYFKREQLPWIFEFLTSRTEGLGLEANRLYVSVFEGLDTIPKDEESARISRALFENAHVKPEGRIFFAGVADNWWSRSGVPEEMPPGEPGGPDSEVYFDLRPEEGEAEGTIKELTDSGRLLEIGNSVFMEYQKQEDGSFKRLPQRNVDFGGGLERLLAAVEDQQDIFQTSLFKPIIGSIEAATQRDYIQNSASMRVITDHLIAAVFMSAGGVAPSNKEQGYILRKLVRRALDNFYALEGSDPSSIIGVIVEQYKETDPYLVEKFEHINNSVLSEAQKYEKTRREAQKFIQKKYRLGDELMGVSEISAEDAFTLYTTHGLSPTQIKSLGYTFDEQAFARRMKEHQAVSRRGAEKKFAGGLADHSDATIHGHTATHLLHQALRDVLGNAVYQSGSNITNARLRFDFNFERKVTPEELEEVEEIVNEKIKKNLPVHFEMMTFAKARELGAIGLFDEKYQDTVKVYFIGGGSAKEGKGKAYSVEFCGGPHVDFTGKLKRFKIVKEEGLGKGMRRIYATVE